MTPKTEELWKQWEAILKDGANLCKRIGEVLNYKVERFGLSRGNLGGPVKK